MMKKQTGKALLALLLLLAVSLTMISAAGADGEKTSLTAWKDRLLTLHKLSFQQKKDGLGLGDCPVYTAPSVKALRLANNRQAVDTDKELYDGGKTEGGWLLVRYDPGNGKIRTGYIPPRYVSKYKSSFSLKKLDNIQVIAANEIHVTDDPNTGENIFATITPGESFRILAKYTYYCNWWYIECSVDGKTARGFIDRDAASFFPGDDVEDNLNQEPVSLQTLGTPSISPLNTEKAGDVLVLGTKDEQRKPVHTKPSTKSSRPTVVYPTRTYPYYARETKEDGKTWYYVFVEEDSCWGWVYGEYVMPQQ